MALDMKQSWCWYLNKVLTKTELHAERSDCLPQLYLSHYSSHFTYFYSYFERNVNRYNYDLYSKCFNFLDYHKIKRNISVCFSSSLSTLVPTSLAKACSKAAYEGNVMLPPFASSLSTINSTEMKKRLLNGERKWTILLFVFLAIYYLSPIKLNHLLS